jgi:predicted HicB family RNase H-like nuclease
MRRKGYQARVVFDAEDGLFVGRLSGIEDVVGFHADSVAGLHAAFDAAVDDYLETCRANARTPRKRFSGQLMLRISPEIHAEAALAAQGRGMSLNQWAEEAMRDAAMADLASG